MTATIATQAGPTVDVRLEIITPDTAALWLERNSRNRAVSEASVRRLASDMAEGRWEINGETIKFDTFGNLIDGQHRLEAVKRSGVTVRSLVSRGLAPESQLTIDLGQPRSAAQQLALLGVTSTTGTAALSVALIRYRDVPDKVWSGSHMPSKTQQIEYVMDHREQLEHYLKRGWHAQRETRINGTAYAAAGVIAEQLGHRDDWHDFDDRFISGENLSSGDPRLALRAYALRGPGHWRGAWKQQQDIAVCLKAIRAHIEGRNVKLLRFSRDEMPMPSLPPKS